MRLTIALILKISGIVLAVMGVVMLLPLSVSLFLSDEPACKAFILSAAICVIIGYVLYSAFKNFHIKIYNRESIIILATCWFVASFAGALPLYFSGQYSHFFNALFEACSGFTTTGATTCLNVEALSTGIILWRSMMQWLGGLVFIVFAIRIVPSLFVDGVVITSPDRPITSFPHSIKRALDVGIPILGTFLAITLVMIILLVNSGLSQLDAIVLAMGTLSTGGFSNYNDGFMHFDSHFTIITVMFFMFITGLSINVLYTSLRKGRFILHKTIEFRIYLNIFLAGSLLIIIDLLITKSCSIHDSILGGFFTVISMLSTTGYALVDYTKWPEFSITIMLLILLVGSCSVSMGSGNKVIRAAVIFELVRHGIESRLHPNAVSKIKIAGKDLPTDVVSSVANYAFLYIITVFAGAFVLAFEGLDIFSCISGSLSLISNTGASFNAPGSMNSIFYYSNLTKVLLCILMVAGRLELYNIVVLIMPSFWRRQ